MVQRNKLFQSIEIYRFLLKANLTTGAGRSQAIIGNRSKNRILNFFLKNDRWPSRKSENVTEKQLGTRFENYISKESGSYDKGLRRIVMSTGRVSNHKRKHNVAEFKQEILDFLKEHGRVPGCHADGESTLRHKLDYYTKEKNDTTLLGKVYAVDKCHLSGIPGKYRKVINENLDVEKPLIRLV